MCFGSAPRGSGRWRVRLITTSSWGDSALSYAPVAAASTDSTHATGNGHWSAWHEGSPRRHIQAQDAVGLLTTIVICCISWTSVCGLDRTKLERSQPLRPTQPKVDAPALYKSHPVAFSSRPPPYALQSQLFCHATPRELPHNFECNSRQFC